MFAQSSCASAPVRAPLTQGPHASSGLRSGARALADEERYRRFGQELDALKARVFARVGAEDVAYVKRMNRFSRAMELAGRLLIHFSPEPVTFLLGVGGLWIHKQLQATEIGHTALHGAYDRLEGAEAFASETFRWDIPVNEDSWRTVHNVLHHGSTNVAGRDPDIDFGPVRLTDQTRHNALHRWQLPFTLAFVFPFFAIAINTHLTEVLEVSPHAARNKAMRKYVPYYLYNFVLFPALAGPFFWKVLLGNALAEVLRDIYSACTIFCGHVGHDVKSYPEGTRARGRGEWYAMQVEAANDFEVSLPLSVLCGGLDRQIEHHLFPTLAPPRLREITPEVRAICERWGVGYKTDTWGRTLRKALAHVARLSRDLSAGEIVREMT